MRLIKMIQGDAVREVDDQEACDLIAAGTAVPHIGELGEAEAIAVEPDVADKSDAGKTEA